MQQIIARCKSEERGKKGISNRSSRTNWRLKDLCKNTLIIFITNEIGHSRAGTEDSLLACRSKNLLINTQSNKEHAFIVRFSIVVTMQTCNSTV